MKFITVAVLMTSSNFNLGCCGSICLNLFTCNLIRLLCFTAASILISHSHLKASYIFPDLYFFPQTPTEQPHTIKWKICGTQKSTYSFSRCLVFLSGSLSPAQRWRPRKWCYSSREAGQESQTALNAWKEEFSALYFPS